MPLRHLPIQRKLVVFVFLTTLTALLGCNLVLFVYESRSSVAATTQSLKTMADIIAANTTTAFIYDDPKLAAENLSELKAEPEVTVAALFDRQGRLYAVYPAGLPGSSLPSAPGPDGSEFTLRSLVMYQPVVQGADRVGTIYLKSDLRRMYRRLTVYGLVSLGVLAGASILAYLLSNFLQRQISQPILSLAETAKAVSERRDYSVRAASQTGDELGFVTEGFNAMLDQIQLSHAALGESEERFRVAADSAPVLIWIADTEMLFTWVNRYWLIFVGRVMAQEIGRGWIENIHPEDRDYSLEIYATAFRQREYFRMECRLLQHSREYRWLLIQGTPRYLGGEFVGFIGSCVDINDNKEAEVMVRTSELQLRMVTDNASVFLCQFDRDHRYKFANKAYAQRYGREVSEIIGRRVSEVIGTAANERVLDRIELGLAGKRQEFEIEVDYPHLGRRCVHLVYEPEKASDGSVQGIVAVLTDTTERQQAAREVERARDAAVKASRAKDDFLAALSHELRTPLNPVLLIATDYAKNFQLSPELREDFEIIRKNVELEARLIDDLLDLTRITNGKMVLNQELLDAHSIVKDALGTVASEVDAKRIYLVLNLASENPTLRGDSVRLQQALWNIMKNAVKFTPVGGRVSIATSISDDRKTFSVAVADTGIGMSADEISHVFEAFTQGDHAKGLGSHRFGGLGLGLAISRKVVEMHSGRITATSAGRDRGSEFLLELPIVTSAADQPETLGLPLSLQGLRPAAGIEPNGAPRSVLLVEDHSPTRIALQRLLERRGYRVHSAATLAEARSIVENEKVHFVISDLGLPDGSGNDLMAELEERYHLKGIALTGYGMESDIAKSRAMGFVAHLTKPVSIQALDGAIAAIPSSVLQS